MSHPSLLCAQHLTTGTATADTAVEVKLLLAAPRGFCAGVRRAIDAVRDALKVHGAPVYVRRAIVHNLAVVRSLEAEGAIFVQEIDQVPPGGVVLFSAHGVAPRIKQDADQRGLKAYDAVCPLVSKVHREVERHQRNGRDIVLIGHRGHPEIEGTLGRLRPGSAWLVKSVDDVARLPVRREDPVAYAVQTTYSVDDASEIIAALQARFPDLVGPATSDICYATTNRQNAVREIAGRSDAVIVVGESFSSNATRLAEVAATLCDSVQLVAEPRDLDWSKLLAARVIGITAAASTPDASVQSIIDVIDGRRRVRVEEAPAEVEATIFKRLAVS
ncbi:MAG: 4-hydroxy-3-methylbut-2-enyl diphosphate reductase [Pseudomonadota bacterium]|nr:4-hydroxy-3-methylbut-2-enyl diphosphate reductase [Pseudomonadota bacterium]